MYLRKDIVVNRPKREVFEYLKQLRNQDHFSVWNMKDPGKKVQTKGTDGTVGFVYSWDSQDKNVGAGSQEIKSIADGERVTCELRFERPMQSVAETNFFVKEISPGQTEVGWDFSSRMKFPMNILSFFMRPVLAKQINAGLQNLKKNLEGGRQ